jgi:16S rRNA (cytosine967-C5)-methyltransferase
MDWLRCAMPKARPLLAGHLERPFLRRQITAALAEAMESPSYAAPRLSRHFRSNRKLGSKDRRRASDSVYGIIRHFGLLGRAGLRSPEDLLRGWTRLMQGDTLQEATQEDAVSDYAAALSLPVGIAAQWMEALPTEEAAALAKVLSRKAPVYLRTNEALISREALRERLRQEGIVASASLPRNALKVEGRLQAHLSASFKGGLFEIQDLSSQRLCEALPLGRGVRVLDYCAGAGGKSLAIAARGAEVFAHDTRKKALRELSKRSDRAGASIQLGLPGKADIVLVDAPCSGTGRLMREPALRWRYIEQDPWQHVEMQAQLLQKAARHVGQGGMLVYSTCSLLAEENGHCPEGWISKSSSLCWPHRQEGDGFYWNVMVRA